ncbi:MAG: hypothetical protein QOJ70_3430 [Acidobacteriota bacterium]|jgi:hypothetical protein|nr:hypothetical protein [Acidobacteriota bacterium]MDT7809617.1 hypothetical protein [Acidobacteriota bacterium]
MMTGTSLGDLRGANTATREELRRQLLALVLAAVLVWYTLVVPANASARSYVGMSPDDEGLDGEVRGVGVPVEKDESKSVDELDWPEFIYPDGN